MTESPNFRDGITSAFFMIMPHRQSCSQWANYSTHNAHNRTLEVFMFPSVSCVSTYFAPEALSDIILN